jgi:hypothetical protein
MSNTTTSSNRSSTISGSNRSSSSSKRGWTGSVRSSSRKWQAQLEAMVNEKFLTSRAMEGATEATAAASAATGAGLMVACANRTKEESSIAFAWADGGGGRDTSFEVPPNTPCSSKGSRLSFRV